VHAPVRLVRVAAAGAGTVTSGVGRAVIIDDSSDMREVLRHALSRGGYDVIGEAADGATGISTVRETEPDVVMLDVLLPRADGWAVLKSVRRLVPQARIVVLSTCSTAGSVARAHADGADGYFIKGTPLRHVIDYVTAMSGQPVRS
jgi:DNA-binding NarL/FixJ family response regulator